jgi:DNA-binding NarL/FixJ family response regulator
VSSMEENPMATQKFRILLADENELVRRLLTFLLWKALSVEIVGEAFSGQAAVDMTKQYEPDAIVIESCMQIVGGSEAFRIIRSEFPKVQIIELASFDNPVSRKKMAQAGANENSFDGKIRDAVLAAVFCPCIVGTGE